MFISFKLKNAVKTLIAVAILSVFVIIFSIGNYTESSASSVEEYVLVLDPGHGGRDGGALAESGAKESDINLNVALKTEAIADFLGVKTVMTRSTDTDGAENGGYSERQNLLDRVGIINATRGAVLVSIHQNRFPSALVRGAEVMYADTEGSRELAELIQDMLVSKLDPANRRVARPAPEELLITSSIGCTGVLVECGFLSCADEAEQLVSCSYQLKISEIILSAYLQYITQNKAL